MRGFTLGERVHIKGNKNLEILTPSEHKEIVSKAIKYKFDMIKLRRRRECLK